MASKTNHHSAHSVHQTVIIRKRAGWDGGPRGLDEWSGGGLNFRQRVTKAATGLFGGSADDLRFHRPFRADAELTDEQLWQVYRMCGDLRAAVDSIARRVSTQDWRVRPTVDPAGDEALFQRALAQSTACTAGLEQPNEDDDWRDMWEKVVRDALVFWHGVVEVAFERTTIQQVEGERLEIQRGPLSELVPVYGPRIHPITSQDGRIVGYVHDTGGGGFKDTDGFTFLTKDQVIRLALQPNTRSPYPVPIIETVIREVTTLVRSSERSMFTMDRSELGPGFLVLTGMHPKVDDEIRESAEHYKARDHKLRIIHSPGATSPAQWLRLEQTFKEIEFLPVTRESKKIIWRNYGVTGVEMGDLEDSNRASSAAELEVGDSHLVEPLLEAITRIVQRRMIPLIVQRLEGDQDAEVLCAFEFVKDEGQTPGEEKESAEAADTRIRSGQTSINEERASKGRPRVEGGDVVRVDGAPIDAADTDDEVGAVDDGDVAAIDDRDTGGCSLNCRHPAHQPHDAAVVLALVRSEVETSRRLRRRQREDLPSDWQPAGRFKDVRVMNLSDLFNSVVRYRRAVEPFWNAARQSVLASTGAAWRAGTVGDSQHLHAVGQALQMLRTEWSTTTQRFYDQAAETGALGAQSATGSSDVGQDSKEQATVYFEQAMAWLDALISDVQTRLIANVQAVRTAYVERAPQKADPGLGPDSELDDLLEAIDGSFNANEFRIDNWSGRLVELANTSMLAGMLSHRGQTDEGDQPGEPVFGGGVDIVDIDNPASSGVQWWVSWEFVGDENMCPTCEQEGSAGIRPASTLNTVPGGMTECRANCRCVLVYWTSAEVSNGTAQKINP